MPDDAAMIFGYVGSSEIFDDAVCEFAVEYTDQTERHYRALVTAVREQRIEATIEFYYNGLAVETSPWNTVSSYPSHASTFETVVQHTGALPSFLLMRCFRILCTAMADITDAIGAFSILTTL